MAIDRLALFRERLPGLVFGGDYNPEQWPRSVWREDMKLMRRAGVNMVSLGVFSWSAIEARDGEFDFGWLDEVMDLLADAGISVALSTPNASPPPWLAEEHPETLLVERDGTRVGVGSRGHFCPSSPVYRDRSRRIAARLAERYGDHPALVLWHIGNEYHSHCFCDLCDGEFRRWLQARHGTIDELNDRWGTTFWGQVYSDWSQVHLPRPVRGRVNPARELDFSRFTSDNQLALFRAEKQLLLDATPGIAVTTNFMQFFPLNDYRVWAEEVDVIAFDSYPDPRRADAHLRAAFQYDLMRSLGHGRPWLLLEQAAGAVSQWDLNLVRRPGVLRSASIQAVGRGADAVMFFQWRASRFGHEKFHSAMVPHGGLGSSSWKAVEALGNELDGLDELVGTTTPARVAVVWDWENRWAVEGPFHPDNHFSYIDQVLRFYAPLRAAHVAVDVVTLSSDLTEYDLLVVPNQYLMTTAQQAALEDFAHRGGHVLVGCFSGLVDENDRISLEGLAAALRTSTGTRILELSPLAPEESVALIATEGEERLAGAVATGWQDDLILTTGRALAHYASGHLAERPAIVENALGAGTVTYLGCILDEGSHAALTRSLLDRAGVRSVHAAPEDVDVTERRGADARYIVIVNHSDESRILIAEFASVDLLGSGETAAGDEISLGPHDVRVLRSPLP